MNPGSVEVLLGEPLARLALVSIVLLAVGAAVIRITCRHSADFRRTLWAALLIGQLCVAPICFLHSGFRWLPRYSITPALPQLSLSATQPHVETFQSGELPKVVEPLVEEHPATIRPTPSDGSQLPPKPFPWRVILYTCWLVGTALLLCRAAVGLMLCSRRFRDGYETEAPSMLLGPGHRSKLRLMRCDKVSSPSAWGLLFPRVVLPAGACHWSLKQRRFVLLHEMVHIRRNDCAVLLLAHCSCAVFWFNPLAWLGYRQLRAAIEHSCDDEVVRGTRSPGGYGEALLATVSEAVKTEPVYGMGMADGPLLVRMQQILDPARKRTLPNRALRRLSTAIVVLVAGAFATIRPSAPHATAANTSDSPVQVIQDRSGHVLFNRDRAVSFPFGTTAANLLYVLSRQESSGEQMQLTIDLPLQKIVEKALRRVSRGGAVLLDPNTGDVLALASVPTFQPGRVVEDWDALNADPLNPLMNRALNATSLGATFLPVTALAGGLKGKWDLRFRCSGGVTFGNTQMTCWNREGHGELGLAEALEHSCNAYFHQYSMTCGVDMIVRVGDSLGLGHRRLLVPGESAGLLPSVEWLRRIKPSERWSLGYTAHLATGLPPLEATPLQMAVVASAIATRGMVFEPRLNTNRAPQLRANLLHVGVDARAIEVVRESMRKTVNRSAGAGENAQSNRALMAGQMGLGVVRREVSAGNILHETDAWFIGFAPYENPRFAIAVCVESDESEGQDSASIAVEIFREALGFGTTGNHSRTATLKPEGKLSPRLKWGEVVAQKERDQNYVEIDMGQSYGIYPNLLVCTDDGIIGYVAEAGEETSKVALIGRGDTTMPVLVVNERNEAVGEGMIETASGENGQSAVELHLFGAAKVYAGDLVKTSGKGGIFPKGHLIGRILDTSIANGDSGVTARVKLSANLDQLEQVAVVVP